MAQRDARRPGSVVRVEQLGQAVEADPGHRDHRGAGVDVALQRRGEARRRHGMFAGPDHVTEHHRQLEERRHRGLVVQTVGTRRDRRRGDDAAGVTGRCDHRAGLDRTREAVLPRLPVGQQLREQDPRHRHGERAELTFVGSGARIVDPAQRVEPVAQRGEVDECRLRRELDDTVGPATGTVPQPRAPGQERVEVLPPPPSLSGEGQRRGRGGRREVVREGSLDRGPRHVRGRVEAGRQEGHRHQSFSKRGFVGRPGEAARVDVTPLVGSGYRSATSFRAVTASFRRVTSGP